MGKETEHEEEVKGEEEEAEVLEEEKEVVGDGIYFFLIPFLPSLRKKDI